MNEQELMTNPTLLSLIDAVRAIPKVEQVRYWMVLRDQVKSVSGENAVSIVAVVRQIALPGSPEEMPPVDKFIQLPTIVPFATWSNVDLHQNVVNSITTSVNNYTQSGVVPLGNF